MGLTEREPVAVGAAVLAVVQAVIAVLVGFEVVHWTMEQVGLAMGLAVALVALVAAWQRSQVTPTVKAEQQAVDAFHRGRAGAADPKPAARKRTPVRRVPTTKEGR